MILLAALALPGCVDYGHEAGMRGVAAVAASGAIAPLPVVVVPQPTTITCNRFGQTVQCY